MQSVQSVTATFVLPKFGISKTFSIELPIATEKLDAKFQEEFGAPILLIEVDKDDKKSWEPLMPSIISKYVVSGRSYNLQGLLCSVCGVVWCGMVWCGVCVWSPFHKISFS